VLTNKDLRPRQESIFSSGSNQIRSFEMMHGIWFCAAGEALYLVIGWTCTGAGYYHW
jgi:hypothetical protein